MDVHYNGEEARLLPQNGGGQNYEAGEQQDNENGGVLQEQQRNENNDEIQEQQEDGNVDQHRVDDPLPGIVTDLAKLLQRINTLEVQARRRKKLCICSIIVSIFAVALALTGGGLTAAAYITLTNELRNNSTENYNLSNSSSSEETQHATYVVIGSEGCSNNADVVYDGITVGFKSDTGTNFQCMPTSKTHVHYYEYMSNHTNSTEPLIYGSIVRYKTFRENNNKPAGCALCRIDGHTTIETLPATNRCAESWTKQYEGFLMTGGICVHLEMVVGKVDSTNEHLPLHHEVLPEMGKNSIYNKDFVLGCVVCSK